MKHARPALVLWLLPALAGCDSKPAADHDAAPAQAAAAHADHGSGHGIVDRDWPLTSVGSLVNPRGAGDQPVTLRFDGAAGRASGWPAIAVWMWKTPISKCSSKFSPTQQLTRR